MINKAVLTVSLLGALLVVPNVASMVVCTCHTVVVCTCPVPNYAGNYDDNQPITHICGTGPIEDTALSVCEELTFTVTGNTGSSIPAQWWYPTIGEQWCCSPQVNPWVTEMPNGAPPSCTAHDQVTCS